MARLTFITFEKVTEDNARVVSENYSYESLSDDVKEELQATGGYPVHLPEKPILSENERAVLYTNPQTKEVWYEVEESLPYVDPAKEIDMLRQENQAFRQSQYEQDMLIMDMMLGGMSDGI